jgi:hypothetical protein
MTRFQQRVLRRGFGCVLAPITILLLPASVRAQTGSISGTVTNAQTGVPIVGIDVGAFNLDFTSGGFDAPMRRGRTPLRG